jgi:hypothetical protein
MAKQVTYTDIANTRAKAEALETVNAYMSKRRDARSTMKQVDEGYKKIEDWTDDKGDYHVTYGLFDDTTGKWSNLTTETYEGISKPAEPKKVEPEKSIEGARQLWNIYNRNEEFEDRLTGYESIEDMDPTAKEAALDDLYRDATANVTKDDKAKSLTIEGLRTGIGLYPNLPPSYEARLNEIDTQVKAGTANINSQEVQAALGDLQKDYQSWKKPSPNDKAGPITINNLRNLANLRNVSDVFTPQIAILAESNLDVGGFAWQEAAKDIKKDITNWSEKTKTEPTLYNMNTLRTGINSMPEGADKKTANRLFGLMEKNPDENSKEYAAYGARIATLTGKTPEKTKTEPTLHNINTLQTGVESMPEGPAKKTATKLIDLMENIEDEKSKEYAAYGARVATLIGQTPKASSEKIVYTKENVKKALELFPDKKSDEYLKAERLYKSGLNLSGKEQQRRFEQAMSMVPATATSGTSGRGEFPHLDRRESIAYNDMMRVAYQAYPNFGELSFDKDYIVTPDMQTAFRVWQHSRVAEDAAKDKREYTGQVVHASEQIVWNKSLAESKLFKDFSANLEMREKANNIMLKFSEEDIKARKHLPEMKQLLFNWVKERGQRMENDPELYYTLLVTQPASKHDFDRFKRQSLGEELKFLRD